MMVGGGLVVAGAGVAIAACWVGYRLATAHLRQLEYERAKYGSAGLPGGPSV